MGPVYLSVMADMKRVLVSDATPGGAPPADESLMRKDNSVCVNRVTPKHGM